MSKRNTLRKKLMKMYRSSEMNKKAVKWRNKNNT